MATADSIRRKVLTRAQLLQYREALRREGKTLVQCHGCFDIVHPGHIRHLQHAAGLGDVLLVTITADAVMNKGGGRPLFTQDLRAENLAALDFVDYVYVNPDATAETLLADVQPDIYIKGREYENNSDPRFVAERTIVESKGGRVVFSSGDIVFSSTALISAMEQRENPFNAALSRLIETHDLRPSRLDSLIDSFKGLRVGVFGETIIDTYVTCDRPDVAGEAPVMSLRPLESVSYDGGSAIIARHLAAMGAHPVLLTAMPMTPQAEAVRRRLTVEGVEVRWVECDGPMLEKQRFLVGAQKVMKLDLVRPIDLDATRQNEWITLVGGVAQDCDAAIFADFGNGLLGHRVLNEMSAAVRPHVKIMAGDVSGRRSGLLNMKGMDLLCPTEAELRHSLHDYDASLNAVVWKLLQATSTRNAFVTLGADGLIAFERLATQEKGWSSRVRGEHVPALAPHAIDSLGCGDALLAAAVLSLASGGSLADAAFLGSVAAAAEVTRLGNAVVSASDLRAGVRRCESAKLTVATAQPAVTMAAV